MTHSIHVNAHGEFVLTVETRKGQAHSMIFPCSLKGAVMMRSIIQKYSAQAPFGSEGTPVQYDIDAMLRSFEGTPKRAPKSLGEIDLSDIEL